MPHDSLTTAADILVDKRGISYAEASAMLGELAAAPITVVQNPEVLEASTARREIIEVDLNDPARIAAHQQRKEAMVERSGFRDVPRPGDPSRAAFEAGIAQAKAALRKSKS